MSAPIHKTCYRCERAVAELVQPADVLGGQCGVCADCSLTLGAREVARKWHSMHPEARVAGMSNDQCSMPDGSEAAAGSLALPATSGVAGFPRGMPVCLRCGAGAVEASGLWWCPNTDCAGYFAGVPHTLPAGAVLPTEHTEHTEENQS